MEHRLKVAETRISEVRHEWSVKLSRKEETIQYQKKNITDKEVIINVILKLKELHLKLPLSRHLGTGTVHSSHN
jgi:hypothetical protein